MIKALQAFGGIAVDNLIKAKSFYSDVIGLELKDEIMGLRYLLPGGGSMFIYEKPDHSPANYTVLNFVVEDINSVVDQLVSDGVYMEKYDNMPAPQDDRGILRGIAANQGPDIAWFKDPTGNILSVLQPE